MDSRALARLWGLIRARTRHHGPFSGFGRYAAEWYLGTPVTAAPLAWMIPIIYFLVGPTSYQRHSQYNRQQSAIIRANMAHAFPRLPVLLSVLLLAAVFSVPVSPQNRGASGSAAAVPAQKSSGSNDAPVKAALITASVTLGGIIVKDLIFKLLEEHRASRRAEAAVYERYSKPLAASASSLLIRMHEIVLQRHRPVYLNCVGVPTGNGPAPTFRAYKKLSTLYRLSSLIGWIRACRREFSFVRVASHEENAPIDEAIDEFERALSDGSWVEQERVVRLIDLWKLYSLADLQSAHDLLEELGVLIDNAIYDVLEAEKVADLIDLPAERQPNVCKKIAELLSSTLHTNAVSHASIQTTYPEAFRILAMREAWVYTDWQHAIGDMMLRRIEGEDRRFEVLGYGEFEQVFATAACEPQHLLRRVCEVFDGVDLSIEDRFDARPRQLRRVARATASLVTAMHAAQRPQSIISPRQLKLATTILAEVPKA